MRYLFLLTILSILFIGCSKEENPTESSNESLVNIWGTNGIIEYETDRGSDITFVINESNYNLTDNNYRKENGNWVFNQTYNRSGNYETDNNFLKLYDEYSTSDGEDIFHYSIKGDKLTLNVAWDGGGIFVGNSSQLTGNNWTSEHSSYNENENRIEYHLFQYIFNNNSSGLRIYNYLTEGRIDSTNITYNLNGNTLSIYREGGYRLYVSIYEIKNNKLYMYGKPGTLEGDKDDYREIVLYKK